MNAVRDEERRKLREPGFGPFQRVNQRAMKIRKQDCVVACGF